MLRKANLILPVCQMRRKGDTIHFQIGYSGTVSGFDFQILGKKPEETCRKGCTDSYSVQDWLQEHRIGIFWTK